MLGRQLVAQGATGQRLPATIDRERVDLLMQPRQLEGRAEVEVRTRGFQRRDLARVGHFDDVARELQHRQRRQMIGQRGRDALGLPLGEVGVEHVAAHLRHGLRQCRVDRLEPGAEARHALGDLRHRARPRQQPAGDRAQQGPDGLQGVDLHRLQHLAVERVDLRPKLTRLQGLAGNGVGLGDLAGAATGVLLHPHREGRAHAVHHRVGDRGGDDLALQAVAFHCLGVLGLQRLREVAHQLLGQVRVLGHVGVHQLLEQHQLAVGQQHRQLRPGQTQTACLALGKLRIRGQVLDLAIQQPLRFQGLDEVLLGAQTRRAHPLHQADGLVLAVVVHQHQPGQLVGHLRQQLVARRQGQLLQLDLLVEQDLDVDLAVRGTHTGRVVDEVGVEDRACLCGLDAAQLGHAQIAALADHLAAHVAAVDAQAVVATVTHVGMTFGTGLDIGADAAVPQQVDRRLQDGAHQLVGTQCFDRLVDAERFLDLRRQRDGLGAAREHPAAFADQLTPVVVPAGTGQLEQALAFLERGRRDRRRVQEDVAVVKRGDQSDVLGQQHAVAEHVTRHVADAGGGEVLLLGVHAEGAEVALDRLPRAARGDAHALVVIADRSTGGERIAHPEVVVGGDRIGGIGETRGALVGRDHHVGIVTVVAHDVFRVHDLAVHQIVGDVEQAVDEHLIAGDAFGLQRRAIRRRTLDDEAALGPDRHDDGVLDHLRLDQPEHLGAEVLPTVRPAQAAAGDGTEAQVDTFHPRSEHEDLAVRTRFGQIGYQCGVELVGDIATLGAADAVLVVAGAQGGFDHAHEAAQDAVFVQAGHAVQQHLQRRGGRLDLGLAVAAARADDRCQPCQHRLIIAGQALDLLLQLLHAGLDVGLALLAGARIEAGLEQLHQQACQHRVARKGLLDVALGERHADLEQELRIRPQHRDLTPGQPGGEDEAVEAVVLAVTAPDARERVLEVLADGFDVGIRTAGFDLEILDVDDLATGLQPVGVLGDHPQPHVFHHRQRVRQRDVVELAVELEAQPARSGAAAVEAETQVVGAFQRRELLHVRRRDRH